MAEMWICGDCRSTNNARDKRCYRCRVPRATSEMTEATLATNVAEAQETRTVLAAATRLGVRYRASWPVALVTGVLILGTTGLDVLRTRDAMALVTADGVQAASQAQLQSSLNLAIAYFVGYVASGIFWSLWMAILVTNVPALTARWPSHGPLGAFFALWIPFIGLIRPFSIVKQVTTLLGGGARAGLLVIAWWVAFLGSFYLPSIVVFLRALDRDDTTVGGALTTGSVTRIGVVIIAAILAALVLLTVEYYQRLALERRSEIVLAPEPTQV